MKEKWKCFTSETSVNIVNNSILISVVEVTKKNYLLLIFLIQKGSRIQGNFDCIIFQSINSVLIETYEQTQQIFISYTRQPKKKNEEEKPSPRNLVRKFSMFTDVLTCFSLSLRIWNYLWYQIQASLSEYGAAAILNVIVGCFFGCLHLVQFV